jgi:hypothetical protein
MPVPIMRMPDNTVEKSTTMDYSFLVNNPLPQRKKVMASNEDARLLFELWANGEQIDDTIKVNSNSKISSKDILRLKTLGFLMGEPSAIKFTRKGKLVITTMSLGEQSQFDKQKKQKNYTEILASMDKRGKKGFRIASSEPKFAINNSNNLNLKKAFGN